jgi:uroporphyrinogen-III synthase
MGAGIVLVTRPEPGASETAAHVAAMDLTPVVAPLLEIRTLPFHAPSGPVAAILLTSGNAIAALPAFLHPTPVLAVGTATARRAELAGFVNVTSADGDAGALAAVVRARFTPRDGTLLLACGRGQSVALAADLRASGYRVARRVAYAAQPVTRLPEPARAALSAGRAVTVLLFSAATARNFVRLVRGAGLLDALARCDAITIGPPAAMALKHVPWARIRVSGKPTQDEMLALLR